MKKRLTFREGLLLVLLVCAGAACAYILLFYNPVRGELDYLTGEQARVQAQLEAVQLRLEDQRRMEHELEEIFAQDSDPVGLAPYDNLKQVMFELNAILAGTQEYSLSFGAVDTEGPIVRRSISMHFSSAGYGEAKEVLRQLHESDYRCMLNDLSISMGSSGGGVSVSGTIVFFEYQG